MSKSLEEIFGSDPSAPVPPSKSGAPKSLDEIFAGVGSQPAALPTPSPPAEPEPGMVQGFAQGAAKPVLKVAASGVKIAQGAADLVRAARAESPEKRNEVVEKNAERMKAPVDFGYFGKQTALGTKESEGQNLREAAGTALEIGSWLVGGGGTKQVAKKVAERSFGKAVLKGATAGGTSGAMGQGGAALADQTKTVGNAAHEALKGGATGVLVGGVLSMFPGLVIGTKDIVNPDAETAFIKAIKPRKNYSNFKDDIRAVLPELTRTADEAKLPINTIEDFNKAISLTKKKVWTAYQRLLKPNADARINGNLIAKEIESTITKRFELQNPSGAKRIRDIAKTYRRSLTLDEAEEFLQSANNDLHAYYAKNKVGQKVAAGDPEIAYALAEAKAIRQQLYSKLSALTGKDAAKLKRLWGALTSIEEEAIGRANVAARQAPTSLSEQISFAQGAGKILKSAANLQGGDAVEGIVQMAGANYLKLKNSTDNLIKSGFKKARSKR